MEASLGNRRRLSLSDIWFMMMDNKSPVTTFPRLNLWFSAAKARQLPRNRSTVLVQPHLRLQHLKVITNSQRVWAQTPCAKDQTFLRCNILPLHKMSISVKVAEVSWPNLLFQQAKRRMLRFLSRAATTTRWLTSRAIFFRNNKTRIEVPQTKNRVQMLTLRCWHLRNVS